MAKKKVTHQSQSNDHNNKTQTTTTPPSMPIPMDDDPSLHIIQNLKNLNSVLLKETTQHRQQIESLLHSNHLLQSSLDHRSSMDADTNLELQLQKTVLFVFAQSQVAEIGSRLDRIVGERNEIQHEVLVLKEQVNDLNLCLENEKHLSSTMSQELEQVKAEAEKREREAREKVEKMKLESEKLKEEKREKEKAIEEIERDRDLAARNNLESAKVIDELKEKVEGIMREKNETEILNNTQGVKILGLEHELSRLSECLENSLNEESVMRAKILELEDSLGVALEKGEEMETKNGELLREKEEMEKSLKVLTERLESVYRVVDMVEKELENRQRELDEANRAKDEIEKVNVSRESEIVGLQGELDRVRGVVDELKECCKVLEEKNDKLHSQVELYRNAVDEVMAEKDSIRKGFDEEKNKVESLELQVNGMEEKIEQAAAELGKVRSEREKMNERNKELESRVGVLVKEKGALQSSLVESQRECDDLKAKVEFSSINSNRAMEMLRSTAALVCKDSGAGEEVVVHNENEKKLGEEMKPYAEELDAIRNAFKVKNEMVDDMKQQLVSMQKSVTEAHKGKSLWTAISSATTILAAALTAYVAKGR